VVDRLLGEREAELADERVSSVVATPYERAPPETYATELGLVGELLVSGTLVDRLPADALASLADAGDEPASLAGRGGDDDRSNGAGGRDDVGGARTATGVRTRVEATWRSGRPTAST
jgi:hypothetical protein